MKDEARVLVFQTFPRFWVTSFRPDWDFLRLKPTTETRGQHIKWQDGQEFSLSAPILNFRLDELLNDQFRSKAGETLATWVKIENANIARIRTGIPRFDMPVEYTTNETPTEKTWNAYYTQNYDAEVVPQRQLDLAPRSLRESLEFIGSELRKRRNMEGAAKVLLLFRELFPGCAFPCMDQINSAFSNDLIASDLCGMTKLERLIHDLAVETQQRAALGAAAP